MSVEAAKAFDISQEDLLKFLGQKEEPSHTTPTIAISDNAKHIILIVSIFLFVVALLTCGCTLCLWCISKKRRKEAELADQNSEKAKLAYNEESMNGSVRKSPTLPQITEKPKLSSNITMPEKDAFDEEELRKLSVSTIDISSSYYVNRDRLQINVRRVIISNVNEQLSKNAYIYIVVSLAPEKGAFYESELRPVAEENYFEEASEFDVLSNELSSRTLHVSIYACDRFSQHRLVNEYKYSLNVPEDKQDGSPVSVLPIEMKELSRSPDNEVVLKDLKIGEVLFSLCYMPTSGRLTFVALKGRSIHDERDTIMATYLRVSLLVGGKVMKTVQTSSVRRSTAPVYNEAFVFHTPLERIKDTDITVSVMTYNATETQPKLLGKITVGPESDNNLGRKHWEAMLTSPRKPVAQWHSFSDV